MASHRHFCAARRTSETRQRAEAAPDAGAAELRALG